MPPPAEADEGTARTPSSQPFSNYEKEGLLNLQILNEQIQELFKKTPAPAEAEAFWKIFPEEALKAAA